MSDIDTLTELFTKFPGIGPRQARRFVYFLLRQDASFRTRLTSAIARVADSIKPCSKCRRYAPLHTQQPLCDICADTARMTDQLMIVEKDTDVEQVEKSGAYTGQYFVLGGTLSLTGAAKKQTIREQELAEYLDIYGHELREIICALSATPDGEYTTEHLRNTLAEHERTRATVTVLGRGLSTGSELEYADGATLAQALTNRS